MAARGYPRWRAMASAFAACSSTLSAVPHRPSYIPSLLLCLVSVLLFASCYPRISPTGPVVDSAETFLDAAASSPVDYRGLQRRSELPVLPFRLWGIDFAEEMLFELAGHPRYAMVEICHVRKRAGEWTWFALIAEGDGRQHVGVATEADFRLGKSFPAPVYRSGLQVERRDEGGRLEYRFSLTLPDGSEMEGTISSRARGNEPPDSQRNGSAMNHSQESALAIIDLRSWNWAKPEIRIDGQAAPVRTLAPFVSYAMRLAQVAGGMAAGQGTTTATAQEGTWELRYGSAAESEALQLTANSDGDDLVISTSDQLIDLEYRFRAASGASGAMELHSAAVSHGGVPVFDVRFSPPIPDLRYPLERAASGRMVAGVGGREGYMTGSYRVEPGDEIQLLLLPDRPFWACERPLRASFQVEAEVVTMRAEVVPALALDGAGAEHCFDRRR
jgi:hypothetical protein